MDRNSLEFIFCTKCYFYWLTPKMVGKSGRTQIDHEETDGLSFLASAMKEGRGSQRRRLQMQSAQKKTIFEFGLFSIIAYSERKITVTRPLRSCGRFLNDSYILSCLFHQNHDSEYATELPVFQPT